MVLCGVVTTVNNNYLNRKSCTEWKLMEEGWFLLIADPSITTVLKRWVNSLQCSLKQQFDDASEDSYHHQSHFKRLFYMLEGLDGFLNDYHNFSLFNFVPDPDQSAEILIHYMDPWLGTKSFKVYQVSLLPLNNHISAFLHHTIIIASLYMAKTSSISLF